MSMRFIISRAVSPLVCRAGLATEAPLMRMRGWDMMGRGTRNSEEDVVNEKQGD
jgi:hypothetical protein